MLKEQILQRSVAYLLKNGIVGVSLRPLANAIGTSDRMLLYHFKTKDELLVEVVNALADSIIHSIDTEVAAFEVRSPATFVRAVWDVFSKPKNRPAALLFYEIEVLSLRQRGLYQKIARRLVDRWDELMERGLTEADLAESGRAIIAHRIGAELVGMFLMHLIRGEREIPQALTHLLQQLART